MSLEKVIDYLTESEGFKKILQSIYELFCKHGRAYGAVSIENPSPEEEKALSNFFNKDYFNQAIIRVSVADFERQIQKNFDDPLIVLSEVLEIIVGQTLPDKDNNMHDPSSELSAKITKKILPQFKETLAGEWLVELSSRLKRNYRSWVGFYRVEPTKVLDMIRVVAEAINNLPIKPLDKKVYASHTCLVRLSDFSKKFAGSFDAFESGKPQGLLLLRAIAFVFEVSAPNSLEDICNMYVKAGLLNQGVLSRVTVNQITLINNDGLVSKISETYNNLNEPFVLTLENLSCVKSAHAINDKVYIIENPIVYAAVCEKMRGQKCTVICQSARINSAFLYLLRLLNDSGTKLYYTGNMDYKGLSYADKLYREFNKSFIPWRYSREDYELVISVDESYLPDGKKDFALHNEELATLLSIMKKKGKTASSMPLVELFVEDMKKNI